MLPAAASSRMAAAMRLPETFAQLQDLLHRLGMFHMDLGLGRVRAAMDRLGLTRPGHAVVQVVGTNGKGATANYLAALATAHGLRAGLFTSPHLVDVRERIKVNGRLLSPALWVEAARAVLGACADLGLTYFELVTLVALVCFRRLEVDLAVLEAGLGGTHDATCAVAPQLVLLTPVGLDHQDVLGPTLEHIAQDKAGALGRSPAVTAPQAPEALTIFRQATGPWPLEELSPLDAGAVALASGPVVDPAWVPGQPAFQAINAALALAGWRRLAALRGWSVDEGTCRQALAAARWPGRFHQDGPVLVDGAHNTMGLAALDAALGARRFAYGIFQSMRDKHLDRTVLGRLLGRCDQVLVPELPMARAWPAADLAQAVGGEPVADVAAALARTGGAPTLLFGSLYLAGAYFALRPQAMHAEA